MYVDHILDCFNGTHRQTDTSLQYLNTIYPNIKLTKTNYFFGYNNNRA